WNEVMLVQPYQLWILRIIAYNLVIRFLEVRTHDPAHVRIPETVELHGMRIRRRIAMAVVVAVVGGPPQDTLLCRGLRHKRYDRLERPGGGIRLMGKVPVVSARYPEHPGHIQSPAYDPVEGGRARVQRP